MERFEKKVERAKRSWAGVPCHNLSGCKHQEGLKDLDYVVLHCANLLNLLHCTNLLKVSKDY